MKGMKTGGRKAGTKNKVSAHLKEIFANILDEYYSGDSFKHDFDNLSGKDRVMAAEKLAAYLLPKSVESNVNVNGGNMTIEERLARLSNGESLTQDEE